MVQHIWETLMPLKFKELSVKMMNSDIELSNEYLTFLVHLSYKYDTWHFLI